MKCPKCKADVSEDSHFCSKCGTPVKDKADLSVSQTKTIHKPAISSGKTIAGKYKIIEEIGRGGMGVVYKAKDTRLDRTVALKFLSSELTRDEEAKLRFVQEAKAAAALNHPNITIMHEIDEHQGQTFIAMEFIQGHSLKKRIEEGPLEIDEAKDIALQVAEGLKEAHDKGIVHRDIKPANIMLTDKGQAKVTDFGLAKFSGGADLTKVSTIMGTLAYMSPEQAKGEEVDHRTDIWSLGAMFYEMLTGERPFQKDHEQALIFSILNEKPTSASTLRSEVPRNYEKIIEKVLEKDLSKRFQNAEEFIISLKSSFSTSPGKDEESIAVFPFANMSADPEQEYFCDGMTEEIISDLSKIQSLRVISRTSSMMLKGTSKSLKKIAEELDVQYVLEGSVRKAGDNLRITAQLIDAESDAHLWAEKYKGRLDDVFDIQENLSLTIVKALKLILSPDEKRSLEVQPISDSKAYDLYLQGKSYYQSITKEGLEKAEQLYKEALEITGENSCLYASLANIYIEYFRTWAGRDKSLVLARSFAQKALDLNADSAQGCLALGLIFALQGDFKESFGWIKKSYELDNTDIMLIHYYGWFLIEAGHADKAQPLALRIAELDPLNPLGSFLGAVHFYQGQFLEAVKTIENYLSPAVLNIPWTRWYYAYGLVYVERTEKALEVIGPLESVSTSDIYVQNALFLKYVLTGDRKRLSQLFTNEFISSEKQDCVASCWAATMFAMLDEYDQALDWLENAVEKGFINYPYMTQIDPYLAKLRKEERFKTLMKRVKHEWENFEV